MIIVRSPLRITLGGGGTDLPSFSKENEGFCISAAISKYVYVGVNKSFRKGINLKYSEYEFVDDVKNIRHPIFREVMSWIGFETPQVEIFSVADVPSGGAGLGNSGAFTVALIKALASYKNISMSNHDIAEQACRINMRVLKNIQGKQDEYASAIGGITAFTFKKDVSVSYHPVNINFDIARELEENLLLFYTNKQHVSNDILKYQNNKTKSKDADIIKNLKETKEIGKLCEAYLDNDMLHHFGDALNKQWDLKEERMPYHDEYLQEIHDGFNIHGAIGNKIIGSGLGGFFLVYSTSNRAIRKYAKEKGLEELHFQFDFEGCKRLV